MRCACVGNPYIVSCNSLTKSVNVNMHNIYILGLASKVKWKWEHVSFLPPSRCPSRVIRLILPFLWPFPACYRLRLLIRQCFHLEGQSHNGTQLNLEMRFSMEKKLLCASSMFRQHSTFCLFCVLSPLTCGLKLPLMCCHVFVIVCVCVLCSSWCFV